MYWLHQYCHYVLGTKSSIYYHLFRLVSIRDVGNFILQIKIHLFTNYAWFLHNKLILKTSNLISSNILCLQWQDWISRVTFSGSKKYDALRSHSPHLKSTKVWTFWFKAFFPKNFRHSFGTTKMVKYFHRTIYIRMVCWNSITGKFYNRTISPIQNTKQN